MSSTTGIEWTDATWNPIRGCSRVSEGCRNCYAEKVAYRFSGPGQPYEGLVQFTGIDARIPKWNGQIKFVEEHLLDPLKWRTPKRVFVNSMSDLFHENVTDEMLDRIFAVMALAPQHTFQVLTKRPERMLKYFSRGAGGDCEVKIGQAALPIADANYIDWDWSWRKYDVAHGKARWPLPNVWLGVSVENQKAADERIPLLLQTPAAKRFISAEPLLGPVDLDVWLEGEFPSCDEGFVQGSCMDDGYCGHCGGHQFDPIHVSPDLVLDWVICGGESGPRARPMHPDWARGLRDQCVAAGVPFFFKQWGEWAGCPKPGAHWIDKARAAVNWHEWPDGTWAHIYGKKAAGHVLDGREWHEFPEASR